VQYSPGDVLGSIHSGGQHVYSPDPPDVGCFPDAAPTNAMNSVVCPLYDGTRTLPPDSGVDCEAVCGEYAMAQNADGVELGYTCDATICTSEQTDLILDACLGLEKWPVNEIFKAEFAAGCSCCASLCPSAASRAWLNASLSRLRFCIHASTLMVA